MVTTLSLQSARPLWERLYAATALQAPFFSHAWHQVWFETLGKALSPLILTHDHELLFPFAVEGSTVYFSGGQETSDYLDVVGEEKNREQAWIAILSHLRSTGYKRLVLHNVPQGSTVDHFRKLSANVVQEDTTPLLKLPASFEEYLLSLPRKWRKELKRKMKNFERDNQGVYVEQVGTIDCLISLMKKNENKKMFFARPGMEVYFRALYNALPHSAKIRCLSVRGELAASIYYFETESSYLLYNSGFDKEKYDSAGLYLKALHIKQAINAGKRTYNFLQGNERYKYELGGQDFFVYTISYSLDS